ncbi:MAG: AMP-binding protein [Acidobacteriota bacterium]|nr:AMP-binding protein [Acidobacteriota bacterium]
MTDTTDDPHRITFGRRLAMLAEERKDELALVFAPSVGEEVHLSWAELDRRANRVARLLAGQGAAAGDVVVVGLPNSLEHVAATFGAWKLGVSVLPLRSDMPAWERTRLLGVAGARLVIGEWADGPNADLSRADIAAVAGSDTADASLPDQDAAPPFTRLLPTSGSTGTPKIIVKPSPGFFVIEEEARLIIGGESAVTMCASPLYHNNGFMFCYPILLNGDRVVLVEHFEAARAVELIERYQVTMTVLVPTMLQRIARLEGVETRDLSSLQRVIYGGAALPEWVARAWLALIPPERFWFVYGGSEQMGATMCTGREWLERPGTVGRPVDCEIRILDSSHREVPVGEVGEIWMRLFHDDVPFEYIGIPTPEPILGGYRTFGDMGSVDADGYLYIADRRQDMIITGGVNVFPAEVEVALSEHPEVADVVVVGLPDPEWGHRVHAIIQARDPANPPTEAELREFARSRLSGPKAPKAFELIDQIPRTSAGKVNRTRLVQERTGTPGYTAPTDPASGSSGELR